MVSREKITDRIMKLIKEGETLERGGEQGKAKSQAYQQQREKWIYEAERVVNLIEPDPESSRRKFAEEVSEGPFDYYGSLLWGLRFDIGFDYISAISERAHRKVLVGFLDDAEAQLAEGNLEGSAAIVGAVFEDCFRRVADKGGVIEKGRELSQLIPNLVALNEFSKAKAKLARVAVRVRTKSARGEWDGFDEKDVAATIDFTRQLISDHFGEGEPPSFLRNTVSATHAS